MLTGQQLAMKAPAAIPGWLRVAQLSLPLFPVELVVLYGLRVQLCVHSKAEDPCQFMPLLQLQIVAGEWQSNTTVRGDALHSLHRGTLKTGGLSALFSSLSTLKKIEPPSKKSRGFTLKLEFLASLDQSECVAILICIFRRGQSLETK